MTSQRGRQTAAMAPHQEPNVEYIDIGSLLERAREALPSNTGTVIHGEAFSYMEAMSAVEIGNAKMDAGMQAAPKTLDQLIADGEAPAALSPPQRLAVLDKLLMHEASWHTGGTLATTVFSCLYMLKPERCGSVPAAAPSMQHGVRLTPAMRACIMQGG